MKKVNGRIKITVYMVLFIIAFSSESNLSSYRLIIDLEVSEDVKSNDISEFVTPDQPLFNMMKYREAEKGKRVG